MNKLSSVFNSRRYWGGLTLIGVAALAVALYYQYGVGDEPCQVCIHARLWVVALILKIRELREKAENELGSLFDIREFHEVILEKGTVTLPLLEKRIIHYIQSKKNK